MTGSTINIIITVIDMRPEFLTHKVTVWI